MFQTLPSLSRFAGWIEFVSDEGGKRYAALPQKKILLEG